MEEYVLGSPESVAAALRRNPGWAKRVGRRGVWDPLSLLSGVIFASVTRASQWERVKWLNSVNWSRVARVFSDRKAAPPFERICLEPGLSYLEQIANSDDYDLA